MQLKIYQENAIQELLDKAKKLLNYSVNKKLVFKAPTGSGKTIMMAEFLKQLAEDPEFRQNLSFIWTAPRQLHIQSREKLEKYFEDNRALRCSFFEELDDRKIFENEILFFNWESINKKDNIYIRENERDNNLSNVLERTKDEGREIVLIIDEAHHHSTSEISQKLIGDIEPKLTVEVSATPVIQNPDDIISVQLEDVKAEGMIKKSVILNEKFINLFKEGKIESELSKEKDSEGLVIDAALKKRKTLLKAFQKENININPLVLIQLPDRIGQLEDTMKDKIIRILKDKYNISTENGKLAIWLSGEHVNKENVEINNSEVEVLIFKQAIALGWDCPRAQIIALFRFWRSLIFSIQTVGRIMRMPEPDKGHYKNDVLNNGYVYTNLSDIEIKEDIARDYITVYSNNRRSDYKSINLLSCYSKRQREKTRLSPLFIEIFLKLAKEYSLKKKINVKSRKLNLNVINDWKAENIDILAGKYIVGDKSIIASSFDLQKLFDFFVRQNLTPFYPEDRSVGRVKESIYKFFEKEFKMDYGEKQNDIVQIVLSDKNIQHFINVIDKAKEEYQKEVVKREPEIIFIKNWNIPESLSFGSNYIKENRKKSIMQPFYTDNRWRPEISFIEYLEKSDKVDWWFKNGDRDANYFAVPYKNKIKNPFYLDFIVKLKDGRLGLFDTKAGFTRRIAGTKIEGLYNYLQSEKRKGKKLFGGIVINTDTKNYRGRWIYFDKRSKQLKENDFTNWKDLDF
ncbi:MAG: DEAD/DEAH box helicase family protein [Candidatus Cloacimonetes bacterium]|nr:DEAD/DEAH box helicase family protein [Candidatus Cloacimonadota bacterium]MBL7086301.1 DEAD/DEAH box helicase family protein [Candidatus Cloacimonadota bacterium]